MVATPSTTARTLDAHPRPHPRRLSVALTVGLTLLAACSTNGGGTAPGSPTSAPVAATAAPASTTTPTPAAQPETAPFVIDDLEGLVLTPDEGDGLVPGLAYTATYSGTADVGDVHHWTLVPTEPLERAGFVQAYSAMFMTPEFPSTFATEGRDLATAVLLFDDPKGARRGVRVFRDTRAEVWEEWRPLTLRGGLGTIGRLGSDNVSVVYPTVGFMGRVGNLIVMVGSQGGSDEGRPLPVATLRDLAYRLRERARTLLAELAPAEGTGAVASCPDGSTPDLPGPADQDRPSKHGGPMAFDRDSGRIVLVETRHDPVPQETRTWSFDVCTNTWMRMDPAVEPAGDVRGLVYGADSDLVVALGGATSGWTYDLDADAWHEGAAPVQVDGGQAVYDPVTGLVLVREGPTGSMYSFDAETGAWADVEQGAVQPPTTDGPMHGQVMTYDPTIDRLVLFVEGHDCCPTTWLFDPRSHRWSETDAETPSITFVWGDLVSGGEIAFDEASGLVVIVSGGKRHVFDGSTLTWTSTPSGIERRFGVRLVYDPVDRRVVLTADQVLWKDRWRSPRSVLAFDASVGRWRELVPPPLA